MKVVLTIFAVLILTSVVLAQEPAEPTEPTITGYVAQWGWGPLDTTTWVDIPVLTTDIYPVPSPEFPTMPDTSIHVFWTKDSNLLSFVFEAADSKPAAQKVVKATINPGQPASSPWVLGGFGRARFAAKSNDVVGPLSEPSYWVAILQIPMTGRAIHIVVSG